MSSDITLLSNSIRDTLRCTIRRASPSTIADLPTPGSPISTGLFFLRRLNICARRSISVSRPITGSRRPSSAARVISLPNLSSTGVSLPRRPAARWEEDGTLCWEEPDEVLSDDEPGISSSSSSSSSPNDVPILGASATLASNL